MTLSPFANYTTLICLLLKTTRHTTKNGLQCLDIAVNLLPSSWVNIPF